jgi:hypothetical protein
VRNWIFGPVWNQSPPQGIQATLLSFRTEVLQLAIAMTEKWRLEQQVTLRLDDLERMVQERNLARKAANIDSDFS